MRSTGKPSGSPSGSPEAGPVPVLLDANALFFPEQHGTDLEAEVGRLLGAVRIAVPASVLRELDRLVEQGVPGAATARALATRFPTLPTRGTGDAAVVGAARRTRAWVVTADRELAARLGDLGVAVLGPRSGGRLHRWDPRRRTPRGPGADPTSAATVMKRPPLDRPRHIRGHASRR